MTPERWNRIEEIYHSALDRDESQRASYLAEACAGDEELRREVESLLANEEQAGGFLEGHALEAAARGYVSAILPDLSGKRLGRYEVVARSGTGGMGEVYRARDTRLKREVALKVLPPERLADPGHRRRFEQEARAASALNHPGIITIYDIDRAEGLDFIAMEYVPGQTLTKRIGRKGLPLRDALGYAVQIADALAVAHGAGIVHRDLKPSNIMINETGQVKVLDFGLAKRTERVADEETGSTETMPLETETGTVLGTAAYMSPEQAEGKKVDARSDIFSFGAVLYEMVTGQRAFQRDSTASTLAAILKEEPKAAGQVVRGLPSEAERIIKRCLRKNPAQRFQHMSDLKVELEELKQELGSGALAAPEPPVPKPRRWMLWAGGLALGLTAALIGIWVARSKTAAPEAALVAVPLTSYPGSEVFPSFSPDGTQVAFQWCPGDPSRNCDIYIKQIGVEPPFRLTDHPAQEYNPVWSPDGLSIAFLRDVSASEAALILVPTRGGTERVLGKWPRSRAWRLRGPYLAWTPDSKWLALPIPDPRKGSEFVPRALFLLSVDTREQRRLTAPPTRFELWGDTAPAFSPDGGRLIFRRDPSLFQLRLSEDYRPLGQPERVEEVEERAFSAAWLPDGSGIVFDSMSYGEPCLLWRLPVGKRGSPRRLNIPGDDLRFPAVSGQENRLAYVRVSSDDDIWRIEIPSPGQRLSAAVKFISSTKLDWRPQYSPDGNKIAFVSDRSGSRQIWVCDRDGSNAVQLTFGKGEFSLGQISWSPGGDRIAYASVQGENQPIHVIRSDGGLPVRWAGGPILASWPRWSRDGRWLYFDSELTIYKMPDGGGEVVDTTVRGAIAQESPDGKTLYFTRGWPSGDTSLWSIPVDGGEETKVLDDVAGDYAIGRTGIYFKRKPDNKGRTEICRYEFGSGDIRTITTLERQPGWSITVSPDERTILFDRREEMGSDIMLVEDFR